MRAGVLMGMAGLALVLDAGSIARADEAEVPTEADAPAETAPASSETAPADTVRVEELVVTGSKTEEERWDATVPTQVIDREKVETTATMNLVDVLAEVPGLYVRRNNQFRLGASTVRMQGADPNKVAVLVDGRRIRGGVEGVVDLRDLPANNVERIEIIRGPASSLYGSDAMAGVINVITRGGTPEPHGAASFAGGNLGRRFWGASQGWEVGGVRYFLSGMQDQFRPFEQYGDISEQFSGVNEDQVQKRSQAGVRLDWEEGSHRLTFTPSVLTENSPESDVRNLNAGGEWQWRTSDATRLTTWANWYDFTRTNDLVGFEEDNHYNDYEAESRWAAELGPNRLWLGNVATMGVRGRYQTLDQELPLSRESSVWQVSPFVQTDITLAERLSLLIGSSFDENELYGLDVNPRGTLTWWPTSTLRVSGTVGRGFRAPDLLQLYDVDLNLNGLYVILGNENLKPETDVGYTLEAELRRPGIGGHFSLYRHDFEELILAVPATPCTSPGRPVGCVEVPGGLDPDLVFQYQNVAKATTQGLETALDVAPLELLDVFTPHHVTVGIAYGLLFTENLNGIEGEDGNELPLSPRHRIVPSLFYRHDVLRTTARIWAEYESESYSDLTNLETTRNIWLWNFKVTVVPSAFVPRGSGPQWLERTLSVGDHLEVFVQGDNVFDAESPDLTTGLALVGRSAFLFGVAARF
jgi:outer membrane receptor for ferrienterochelin and colicins